MLRRCGVALLLLTLPGLAHAQEAEDLLPAGAQIYLRWDGIEPHRAAYEKTALGKTMQGDTGKFITGAFKQLQDSAGAQLVVQQLLGGVAPDKLQKLQADAAEAPKLLTLLSQNGFVMSVELRKLEPPDAQIMLVLPGAGDKAAPLFASLRLATTLAGVEIKEKKIADRAVSQAEAGPLPLAWWVEGKHAVLTLGTEQPEAIIKNLGNKDGRLTGSPLYKRVRAFKQFETVARAYVDVPSLVKLARTRDKDVAKLIDDLGLDGLQGLTFYSGFDGSAERSLVEWEMPGPRKGALKLLAGKPFKLSDVPPLPTDTVSWSMTNFDAATLYDVGLQVAEGVVKLVAPEMLPMVKEFLKQADALTGINLRNDLLGALGGQMLVYSSPAEGPLSLGQTLAFKVKDEKKLKQALEDMVKGIAKSTGADVTFKKKMYRGVELRELHFKQEGFFFMPTYAIYKDWLVVGYYPQAVQGFILRATGELPAWKPDARLQASLEGLPKEFISITVTDPVPSIKQLLSIAPLIGGLINSFAPDVKFDTGSLPNAHEATRYLFPNVSIVTDDGKALRMETRASLALPFDLSGLDTYSLFFFFAFARGF